jgi:hypothetical protein
VYYHFDYHGGPRSYQWVNANPIAKIWEQMSMAKDYGADRIWIVNVGHFKGYEFPIEYFMDLAWNTGRWRNDNIHEYTELWAKREFGAAEAGEIAALLAGYTKYNGRRKPELLSPSTYSLVNYHEAETVVADFNVITRKAEDIFNRLPAKEKDAFYELVLFPIKASALVNELYLCAGKNALYAKQGRSSTNDMASETRALFSADTALMGHFNRTLVNGKWDHFMDQTHLGYTGWQDPPTNSLRAIPLLEIEVPGPAAMGVAVEGSEEAWPGTKGDPNLPGFDPFNRQRRLVEIFNKGNTPFSYTARADNAWITLSSSTGDVVKQVRVWVSIDWSKAPRENAAGTVTVTGTGQNVAIHVTIARPAGITPETLHGFIENDGYVSMEAEHFTKKTESGANRWIKVEDYGRTLSAMRATSAIDAPAAMPGKDSPCLEYRIFLTDSGKVEVRGTFGPTLNFRPGRDLRYAVSFDDNPPELVTLVPQGFIAQHGNMDWEKTVGDNARFSRTTHEIVRPGYHTLKIWMVDSGVVLEKIVVHRGGLKESYLGPPESFRR